MSKAFWGVALICLVCVVLFWLFKIVRLIWKRSLRLLHKAFNKEVVRETFPEEAFPSYEISERDFMRIAYKAGYRNPKTEEILVDGSHVEIRFSSQTGYSKFRATLDFELSGRNFGEYTLYNNNPESGTPRHIANIIRSEMRKQVGLY